MPLMLSTLRELKGLGHGGSSTCPSPSSTSTPTPFPAGVVLTPADTGVLTSTSTTGVLKTVKVPQYDKSLRGGRGNLPVPVDVAFITHSRCWQTLLTYDHKHPSSDTRALFPPPSTTKHNHSFYITVNPNSSALTLHHFFLPLSSPFPPPSPPNTPSLTHSTNHQHTFLPLHLLTYHHSFYITDNPNTSSLFPPPSPPIISSPFPPPLPPTRGSGGHIWLAGRARTSRRGPLWGMDARVHSGRDWGWRGGGGKGGGH